MRHGFYHEDVAPGCDEYLGVIRLGAVCENCGERCENHNLPKAWQEIIDDERDYSR